MVDVLGYTHFEEKGTPYKDLDALIARCEARKRRYQGVPRCPYCDAMMRLRHSAIAGGSGSPLRDDQGWKCVQCFHTAHFGIPITRSEYEEEYRLRGGRIISRPTQRVDERDRAAVLKRLRALGYMDFRTGHDVE